MPRQQNFYAILQILSKCSTDFVYSSCKVRSFNFTGNYQANLGLDILEYLHI